MYRFVALCAVTPIIVEAVRRGLSGWIPVQDAAPTVLRASTALGTHPSLVGMFTDSSNYAGAVTYFPGAWQLYWLWAPIRVLGTTWGPLIGMAVLNIGWVLLAGWFVKRRLGHRAGAAALVFVALLEWVLSPALLVSPVPMVMVLPAFAAYCFGAWALAAGDEGVLPLFALVANFLLLDHLVLSLLVPVIGGFAVVCWIAGLAHRRRSEPARWPQMHRRNLRVSAAALGVTLVMWLPPLIQQFTHEPGNLTNLWRAGRAQPDAVLSLTDAAVKWLSLFVAPNFWLRPSRTSSYLMSSTPSPSRLALVVAALALVTLWLVGAVAAYRRRDRPAAAALGLAAVAAAAVCVNITRAVGPVVRPARAYVQSTWVVAMFVTFALAYALARAAPAQTSRLAVPSIVVAGLVVTASNLPHAAITFGVTVPSDATIQISRRLTDDVLAAVDDGGIVAVRGTDSASYPYTSAAIVALNDAGVPVCSDPIPQFLPSPIPACTGRRVDHTIRFVRGDPSAIDRDGWRILSTVSALTDSEQRELERESARIASLVRDATARGRRIRLAPAFAAYLERPQTPQIVRDAIGDRRVLDSLDTAMATPSGRASFADYIRTAMLVPDSDPDYWTGRNRDAIEIPGITWSELARWADLEQRMLTGTATALVAQR